MKVEGEDWGGEAQRGKKGWGRKKEGQQKQIMF